MALKCRVSVLSRRVCAGSVLVCMFRVVRPIDLKRLFEAERGLEGGGGGLSGWNLSGIKSLWARK